jgi:putative holliday junction resolvase
VICTIAIDLGDKRTGIATGDTRTRHAMPVTVLEVAITHHQGQALLEAIVKEVTSLAPAGKPFVLVVGLPLNMDGSEGPRAKSVRAFTQRIHALLPWATLAFQDERLTSAQADWDMAQSGLTHKQKKSRRDALAAAALLQDYLNAQPRDEVL